MRELAIILFTFHAVSVSSYRTLSELFRNEQLHNHLPKSPQQKTTLPFDENLLMREVVQAIMYIIVTLALSIIGCCFRKCYQNHGHCKWSWFLPKTPAEYSRRRAVVEARQNMVMEFIQQQHHHHQQQQQREAENIATGLV